MHGPAAHHQQLPPTQPAAQHPHLFPLYSCPMRCTSVCTSSWLMSVKPTGTASRHATVPGASRGLVANTPGVSNSWPAGEVAGSDVAGRGECQQH